MTETGLSSIVVAEAADIPYQTLVRWIEAGTVTPSVRRCRGAGDRHQWSDRDLLVLAAIPFRYFAGCCWREVGTREEMARRLIEDGDV